MKLYICEKPSQAKDIAAVLGATTRTDHCFEGAQIVVTWCVGHLLELAPPDSYCDHLKPWRMAVLPVVPDIWTMLPQEKTKKQLTAIGKLLKKSTSVVIATDADREGDVIGREVLDYFNFKGPVERLWLSALDEASIKKALLEIRPGHATENLYQAGLGRQRADWLVGMNLTMAVSSLYGVPGQGVLSVGRVQTPTLQLVVNRDLDIEHFKARDYFVLNVQWETMSQELFWTTWEIPDELSDEEGRCINKDVMTAVINTIANQQGIVGHYSEQQKKTAAPVCLSLSVLQKIASAQFGFSAKETLETAQSLYEKHKATTYPRTDCGYLPESQLAEAGLVMEALSIIDPAYASLIAKANPRFKSRVWNDKKISAHHGIIPTKNKRVDLTAMSPKERTLYALIRAYYLAQFLNDYTYVQREIRVDVRDYRFKAMSNTPIMPGWKEAIHGMEDVDGTVDNEDIPTGRIPQVTPGACLTVKNKDIDNRKTKAPARFTEGTLITAMKSIAKYVDDIQLKKILKDTAGIGTEATRANILETLVARDYIKRHGKQLISTSKGRDLVTLLPPSITNPATTALWEQVLDSIANGHSALADFLDDQRDTLEGILEQLAEEGQETGAVLQKDNHPCPQCQKTLYRRQGKKGHWWGCSGFPECKTTFVDDKGKPKYIGTLV